MARLGKKFVADNRRGAAVGSGSVTFYEQPVPDGQSFCRLKTYTLAAPIVENRAPRANEHDDNLTVTEMFGIWKRPGSPDQGRLASQQACAAYRDFDHLFSEENLFAGRRGAYLLDTLITAAQTGHLDFPHQCGDVRLARRPDEPAAPCDMMALLRRLNFKQSFSAATKSEKPLQGSTVFIDELMLWTGRDHGREFVMLTIESRQKSGPNSYMQGDIVSLNALIDAVD